MGSIDQTPESGQSRFDAGTYVRPPPHPSADDFCWVCRRVNARTADDNDRGCCHTRTSDERISLRQVLRSSLGQVTNVKLGATKWLCSASLSSPPPPTFHSKPDGDRTVALGCIRTAASRTVFGALAPRLALNEARVKLGPNKGTFGLYGAGCSEDCRRRGRPGRTS